MRLTVQWQDRSREPHAGQFYMLRAWAADATPILSRPISVDDFDNQTGALTFLYQVKGEGTHKLAALKKDDTLTVTGPCGNGFDTAALAGQYKRIAVVGGGIGTAPLLLLCKELAAAGCKNGMELPVSELSVINGVLKSMSSEERVRVFRMRPDRADVIIPAAEIFLNIAERVHADSICVPTIGITDGIAHALYIRYLNDRED